MGGLTIHWQHSISGWKIWREPCGYRLSDPVGLDRTYKLTVGYAIKALCHIQIDYHHRLSGINSRCYFNQPNSHTHSKGFLFEKAMLASVDRFVVYTVRHQLRFDRLLHKPRDNEVWLGEVLCNFMCGVYKKSFFTRRERHRSGMSLKMLAKIIEPSPHVAWR